MASCAVWAWRQGWWRAAWRVHYSLVALAALAVTFVFASWKLIGI